VVRPLFPFILTASCASATGGQQVPITADLVADRRVEIVDGEPQVRVPRGDHTLVVTHAQIAVGPVYLWTLAPDLGDDAWTRRVPSPLGVTSAQAQDQVSPGRLVGEIPHQQSLDLLREPRLALGAGTAVVGPAGSADIWLEPHDSGPTVSLRGFVEGGEEPIPFVAQITWATPWVDEQGGYNADFIRRIRGIGVELDLQDGAHIDIGIDVERWFDQDFVRHLPDVPTDANGVRVLTPDHIAGRALDLGIRRIGASGPWSIRPGEE
jgi:hypothetical protein